MEIQSIDKKGIDLIKEFEGCILHPYRDKVGIPTIGYGMTYYPGSGKKVTMIDKPITQQQADQFLLMLLRPYELGVYSTTRDDLTQNNFNALVSLTYNIGTTGFKNSTVHSLVQQNINDHRLNLAFLMWNKGTIDGKHVVIDDLTDRRGKEYLMYIS